MALINMTPHPINIYLADGGVETIPSSGVVRVSETLTDNGEWGGYPRTDKGFGDLVGLPAQQDGTYYVVSAVCAPAIRAAGRTDCAVISREVRNDLGRTIGCRAFSPILP